MNSVEITPEYIIVEDDHVVLMDLRDLVLHEFQRLALCIETVEALVDLLAGINGPAVVIAGCNPKEFLRTVGQLPTGGGGFAAVLITDDPDQTEALPAGMRVIASPFSSETLLSSVRSAYEHLRSGQS